MKGTLRKATFLLLAGLTVTGLVAGCSGKTTTAPPVTITQVATTTAAPVTVVTTAVTTAAPTTVVTTAPPSTIVTTAAPVTVVTTVAAPITKGVTQASSLTGAGSTFDNPLFTQWFSEYAATGVQVNYQSVGSGAGITAITNQTVDFGASDGILTSAQNSAAQAASGPILMIPVTAGATAVIYNIAGISTGQLKLTGTVLANIYLGLITKWNDPAITALNPGLNLPNAAIATVHRSDSSGTTNIFTNYLSKVSTQWNTQVGFANSVTWPTDAMGTGFGGSGSAGVAGSVQQTPNSIGYDEMAYAINNNLAMAQFQNASGAYILPSVAAATAAANGVTIPTNSQIMITNSSEPTAYPIVGFSWMLVYQNQVNIAKAEALVNMLWWAVHTGQKDSPALYYAQLSSAAVTVAENLIKSINIYGQPVYTG